MLNFLILISIFCFVFVCSIDENPFKSSKLRLVENRGLWYFQRKKLFFNKYIDDQNDVDGCMGGMYQWTCTRYFRSKEEALNYAMNNTIEYQNWYKEYKRINNEN